MGNVYNGVDVGKKYYVPMPQSIRKYVEFIFTGEFDDHSIVRAKMAFKNKASAKARALELIAGRYKGV